VTRSQTPVTRHEKSTAFTIEKLACDCLDVRDLRRKGILGSLDWITFRPMLGRRTIVRMQVVRYAILLDLRGHTLPQRIRVSWEKLHFGCERPWMHCPHCEKRVARLYEGLAGYFCPACVGNPIYASQALSAQSRGHFQACKLRLRLGGIASLTAPLPERPRKMHKRTYHRLKSRLLKLEDNLSPRVRRKPPDYPSLVAYFP
jgi:hypothetical protein